ncbi:MAG: hypothetical protein ACFFD2_19935 [Promethearchaeota archaeon]
MVYSGFIKIEGLSISDVADGLLLIESIILICLGFGLTPIIIRQMILREKENTKLIYPFVIVVIINIISILVFSPLSYYIHFYAFPTYVEHWLSLRNLAIQWFFTILINIFTLLIYTVLLIYVFDLKLKKALTISIVVYVLNQFSYAFLSRIISMFFSILATGSMSFGPI